MKSPSHGRRVIEVVPEHRSRSERRSPRSVVGGWSRQSPCVRSERRSPRAVVGEWSSESPSTSVVWPESPSTSVVWPEFSSTVVVLANPEA